ncbi:MAG: hypothetical protein ACRDVM_00750 [Acidimicrobiia bacterium]
MPEWLVELEREAEAALGVDLPSEAWLGILIGAGALLALLAWGVAGTRGRRRPVRATSPDPHPEPHPDPLPGPDPVPEPVPNPGPQPRPQPVPEPLPDPEPLTDPEPRPGPAEVPQRVRWEMAWAEVERRFVWAPVTAVEEADRLIRELLSAPADRSGRVDSPEGTEFEARLRAITGQGGPTVAERYRMSWSSLRSASRGEATTEELRLALIGFREVLEGLLEGEASSRRARVSARSISNA